MPDFSFEDIHELLRAEKYSSDLQTLSEEQLAQISKYLENKRLMLQKQRDSNLFENNPDDKLRDELDNANRALKDFYDRREKKIITRAIFTARSVSKLRDTTNMLKSEVMIYDNLVNILKNSWAGFFSYFDSRLKPCDIVKSEVLSAPETYEKPLNNVSREISINPQQGLMKLQFTDDVPELLDSELKRWGPFAKEQIAEIPAELAELLLKQSKATGFKN